MTDAPMEPKPASAVHTVEEEDIAVAFRQHTLRPLDDGLYAVQQATPTSRARPCPAD
ncbi:MAG: hypothetical protein ACRYG7_11860 [Janthinobacterium lividum]